MRVLREIRLEKVAKLDKSDVKGVKSSCPDSRSVCLVAKRFLTEQQFSCLLRDSIFRARVPDLI